MTPCLASFNPRPRAGGDSRNSVHDALLSEFQSTPPRGGRLRNSVHDRPAERVSIHAPARGATFRFEATLTRFACFNPRPRAGGDWFILGFSYDHIPVSIHAPARGATVQTLPGTRCDPVSIHAPARGATRYTVKEDCCGLSFQSTPPRGGRLRLYRPSARCNATFQSTPPRGGRPKPNGTTPAQLYRFNPRPRAGGDISDDSRPLLGC